MTMHSFVTLRDQLGHCSSRRELMFLRLGQFRVGQSQQALTGRCRWGPSRYAWPGVLDQAGPRLPGLAVRHWLMTCGLSGRGWVLCRVGSDIGPLCARALPRQPAAVVAELTARGHLGREMPSCKGGDTLEAWAGRTGRRRAAGHGRGILRFAFYGRVSTEDWQDPVTSRHGSWTRPPLW